MRYLQRDTQQLESMASNVKLYDLSRSNHEAAKEALTNALSVCRERDIDGAIIILSRRDGGNSTVISGGALSKHDKANLELFKVKLHMAIET